MQVSRRANPSSPAIHVGQLIRTREATKVRSHMMTLRGAPAYLHSDNGCEFATTAVMRGLRDQQVGPAFSARSALAKRLLQKFP